MSSTRIFGLVLAQGINAIVNFLFLPYLVRALSKTDYGTYGQVLLVADSARTLFTMGLTTVLYVRMASAKNQADTFKNNFIVSVGLGFLGCLAVFFSADYFSALFENPAIAPLLKLYSAQILFFIPFSILNSLLIFLGNVSTSVAIFTFSLILRVIFIVGSVEIFHSLSYVFVGLVVLGGIQFLLGWAYTPKTYFKEGRFEPKLALSQLTQGFQLGIAELLGFAIAYTDKFMVSSMLSTEDFAIFRNGSIEIPVIGTLYTSIAAVILPVVSNHYSKGNFNEIVRLKKKIITVTMAAIYPAVFFLIFFSQPLITLYLSEKYAASARVFSILCLALLLRVNDYMDLLVSANRGRTLVACYFLGFSVNLVINPLLIRSFGYTGAAASTVLTTTLLLCALFYLSSRVIGVAWTKFLDLKKIAVVVGVSSLIPFALSKSGLNAARFPVLAAYGMISFSLSYLIFLKADIIEYSDVSHLVKKIPVVGPRADRLMARVFAAGRPVRTDKCAE